VCVVSTNAWIVGHWIATKRNDLPDTTTKMTATEITSSMAIVTIVTKRAIKKWSAGRNYRFNGNCNYCDKKGHTEADCRTKQRDNAGENRALEDLCIEKDLDIIFEYSAPGTPQQNEGVERAFATMLGKIRLL